MTPTAEPDPHIHGDCCTEEIQMASVSIPQHGLDAASKAGDAQSCLNLQRPQKGGYGLWTAWEIP